MGRRAGSHCGTALGPPPDSRPIPDPLPTGRNPTRHTIGDPVAETPRNPPVTAASTIPLFAAAPSEVSPLSAGPPVSLLVPAPALDQLLDEAYEFGGLEGLGEKGVHADVETGVDLVLRAGADDGEGQMVRTGVGAEPGGGAQAVQPGHDDIERHHIGPHLVDHIQTLGTIGRGHDLEPFQLEIDPDQLPDDLVVVHNKHPTRGAWHTSRVGPDRPPRPGFPHFHPVQGTRPGTQWTHPVPHPRNGFLITPPDLIVFYPSPRAKSSAADTPP